MIKSGAFDSFGKNRATLLASYENIIDTIANEKNKEFSNQITMFDIANDEKEINEMKYKFEEKEEFSEKELLSMEKEMLGIYISGHPLEKYRKKIEETTNLNTILIEEGENELEEKGECTTLKDNSDVVIAGIITNIKKKFTKNNKIMAFLTIEDLYGTCDVIVFENCYKESADLFYEDSTIIVSGRLSIREDQGDITIIANKIVDLDKVKKEDFTNINRYSNLNEKNDQINKNSSKMLLDITKLDEKNKDKLRGAILFFRGERNNLPVFVKQGEKINSCGAIFATEDTINEFAEIVGKENIFLKQL